MNQTNRRAYKTPSRRKSKRMKGGIEPATISNAQGKRLETELFNTTGISILKGCKVVYNYVEYTIESATDNSLIWTDMKDKSTLMQMANKNKKWLIGDAIEKIYGVKADYFNNLFKTKNDQTISDTSTISKVEFNESGVILTGKNTKSGGEIQQTVELSTQEGYTPFDKQRVLDYYLQTINQTSWKSATLGATKRAVLGAVTGKSMESQLQDSKSKRPPLIAEITKAFQTSEDKITPVYDEKSGELHFKAKILTDGNDNYTITDIAVDEKV